MYKFILSITVVLFFSSPAITQRIITGKVLDSTSLQPLEAVSITVQSNNKNVAVTNREGNFSIKVNEANAVLITSSIGYKTVKVDAAGSGNVNIKLKPEIVNLKDVVLTQYTTQNKLNGLAKVDLDLNPVKNTQELMRLMPGLFVAQHAGGGKAEQIFLRGFDCDHGTDIQVSVDGLPVNMVSHAHGQGYADAHFIIPETINNIDYGAGPYYAGQGNLNTAGYVSFSSFKNISKSRVQVEVGRFNTVRALAMVDLLKENKDKQSAYIAGEYNYTEGPTINSQNFRRFNLFGKYNLAISSYTGISVSLSAFKSKWDASGQVPTRAVNIGIINRFGAIDPTEGGNTERSNANVLLSHTFANGALWENQAYFSRYKFSLFSNFTFFMNDSINGDGINQAEKRNLLGYSSKITMKKVYDTWTLHSMYGAGIRYDVTNDSYLSNTVKRAFLGYVKRGDIKESNTSAYIQQQASAGKWLIDGGLRFDYLHFGYFDKLAPSQMPSQGKAIVSPKLNIQYTVNPMVQLYVKAGKGFHSNDSRVVTANEGREILPAAYGADIGLNLKPASHLLINIAAWYLHLNQEFVYVGDNGIVEPSGKTKRHGIDVVARYQISNHLFANVNLNFTKPRAIGEVKGADYIPLAPTFTSTGGLFYKKKSGLNGGVTYRFISDRPANEDNSIVAKGYFLLDGSVNYTKSKFELGVAVENIFNIDWNEAQFATESRLVHEPAPITELNFTPGNPVFVRAKFAVFF